MVNMKNTLLLTLICTTFANASIVLNSNVGLGDGTPFSEYSLYASATEDGSGNCAIYLNQTNTSINCSGRLQGAINIELSLTPFGGQIGEGTPILNNSTHDVGYGDFYMSILVLGDGLTPPSQGRGWALLNNSPTEGLTMKSNAMAYGEDTLTVGAVPEPATILLFGLGGFGAWLLRRNKMHNSEPRA